MPRRARMYIAGMPYHVVQRGNNRQTCFWNCEDYRVYLDLWQSLSEHYGVVVHAYCLMTNHIHFLVTPLEDAAVSNTMKVVGSRYARYVNWKYDRTGTMWEGRHRASLVQSEKYLLTCYRYIELNPVRAGIVERPEHYRWSSHGCNAWGGAGWVTPHEEYIRLGQSDAQRQRAYRQLFKGHILDSEIQLIRNAACYGQPVSDGCFRKHLKERYGIKLGRMKRGRPAKEPPG